jgi:hypothetical protein
MWKLSFNRSAAKQALEAFGFASVFVMQGVDRLSCALAGRLVTNSRFGCHVFADRIAIFQDRAIVDEICCDLEQFFVFPITPAPLGTAQAEPAQTPNLPTAYKANHNFRNQDSEM